MTSTILHFDLDAFFASVEQRRNPFLHGKPVIVGAGVIASCSYEARKYGLHAGMSITNAKRLCPKAFVVEGNAQIYRCITDRIFEMCHEISPSIETYLDEAYCSFTGTELVYKHDLAKPAIDLKLRIKNEFGLNTTVGLGKNRMIAKMASKSAKPNGFRVIENGEEDSFICNMPIESLPGVGRKVANVLRKFNINSIKEVRKISLEHLQLLFGKNGAAIYERCRGNDSHVINEREIPRTISRETTFHNETINLEEIYGMIHYLTERAMNTLRALKLVTKTVKLKIKYADFIEDSMSKTLLVYTDIDTEIIEQLFLSLKIIYKRRVGLRLVGITLANLRIDSGYRQLQLFDINNKKIKKQKLYSSIDAIRNRYGFSSIVMGKSINNSKRLKHDRNGYILRTPSLTK